MLYERKQNQQVVYIIPISSILGKLPLIPVGDTATIPFSMRDEADELHEVDEASCDTKPGEGDMQIVVCQSMGLVMVQNNVALNGTKGESAVIFCF